MELKSQQPEAKEYPKYLYGKEGAYRIVKDPDEHAAALSQGFTDTAEEAKPTQLPAEPARKR